MFEFFEHIGVHKLIAKVVNYADGFGDTGVSVTG
jgi:hypothetical protein